MTEKTEFLITARDETREAFRSVEAGLGRVSSAMGSMLAPLAALAGVAGFGGLIKTQIDLGDQLSKTSQKLGIAVEDLSAYQYAAKLSDISNEQLTGGMAKLAKTMQDAASNKSGEAAIAFRALGISVTDTAGNLRPLNLVLDEVSQRFEETRDGTNKTAMAMQLFGRSGSELVPLLNSLHNLSAEARRTGNIVSTEFAKKSEQLNDNFVRMEKAAGNFARTLAGAVVPALASMIERLNVAIGAQESLSLDLLQKDKEFLQVEYKAIMQAAEKGYIINTNRAEFLKKQIDEIDAKIAAAESKAAVAAAMQGNTGQAVAMPEMPSINRQGDVEGIGDKEAEQTAKYLAELSKQLDALYTGTASKLEAIEMEQAQKQALLDQGFFNGLTSEQLYYEQSALLREQYEEKISQAQFAGLTRRQQQEQMLSKQNAAMWSSGLTGKLEVMNQIFSQGANLMQSSSKKQFEVGKKMAIGQALISTYLSAQQAFTSMSSIPIVGTALGAVAAGLAIASGMANVSRIRSQQFGGGGGGAVPTFNASPNTGLPTTSEPATPIAPSLPQTAQASVQPRNVSITLVNEGIMTPEYVRNVLIPGLNEALGDGVNLRVA